MLRNIYRQYYEYSNSHALVTTLLVSVFLSEELFTCIRTTL